MDQLSPIFRAGIGDQIRLTTVSRGTVIAYFAVLERFDSTGSHNEAQWDQSTLETVGGTAITQNVSGYNVIIFPELAQGGSIDATLSVGTQNANATISANRSAGWRIFIF